VFCENYKNFLQTFGSKKNYADYSRSHSIPCRGHNPMTSQVSTTTRSTHVLAAVQIGAPTPGTSANFQGSRQWKTQELRENFPKRKPNKLLVEASVGHREVVPVIAVLGISTPPSKDRRRHPKKMEVALGNKRKLLELTDAELDVVCGGGNFTTVTPSGNSTNGKGEGLTVLNNGGNAPPGQQF
jgi:hypothetical protein